MNTGPPSREDDRSYDRIETLLRHTGRRPPVPADRARRVEATVREHWRAELRRRSSRRRRTWAAAALATAATVAAAIGLGLWQRIPPATETAALVEMVVDSAWLQLAPAAANSPPVALLPGAKVELGSELATERHGLLAIRMSTGHSVRIDSGTRVRLLAENVLALDRGAVYVDSIGPGGPALAAVEIRTPLGNVRELGTQFEVRQLGSSMRVRVREGKVTLDGRAAAVEVSAGHELQLGEDGSTTRRDLIPSGADWLWIAPITPLLELEGRTLQEFLDWIARERGLRVQFASAEDAAAARRTILSGSIDGMTLDEALDSVLPTCRMSHRIAGDQLLIEPFSESARS